MNNFFRVCVSITVIILLPLTAVAQDSGGNETLLPISQSTGFLKVGTDAPTPLLKDISGAEVNLSEHIGRTATVLSFWSIYCDSCVDEMIALQKLEDKYRGQDLVIMAVNEDIEVPLERIRRFLDRLEKFRGKISYPLIYDEEERLFNAFGVSTLPTLVLIDKQGKIMGYYHGFDARNEKELLSLIEDLVTLETVTVETPVETRERIEILTAIGEAALCGFFDKSGWRKSFMGNESLEQEKELTRELSARAARRGAVSDALRIVGIELYANEPLIDCVSGDGIHLERDPYYTDDSLSNLLSNLNYEDFFETVSQQDLLIDRTLYTSRTFRVSIDSLFIELKSQGYLFEPLEITFAYVNMSPLDQKQFLQSLLKQSRFIGQYESPVVTPHSTSQLFEVYTSSQGFADEILGMDFGKLQVFVEEVTPTSLELEVWK